METISDPYRLPWDPHPEGGFIAFPEGRAQKDRYARLTRHSSGPGTWLWSIRYDAAFFADVSESKQAGSDAANRAWPRVKEKAAKLAERKRWEGEQLALVDDVAAGRAEPSVFAIEAANYENLMFVMDQIRRRPRTAGLTSLIDALSREFFNRRTAGRSQTK